MGRQSIFVFAVFFLATNLVKIRVTIAQHQFVGKSIVFVDQNVETAPSNVDSVGQTFQSDRRVFIDAKALNTTTLITKKIKQTLEKYLQAILLRKQLTTIVHMTIQRFSKTARTACYIDCEIQLEHVKLARQRAAWSTRVRRVVDKELFVCDVAPDFDKIGFSVCKIRTSRCKR